MNEIINWAEHSRVSQAKFDELAMRASVFLSSQLRGASKRNTSWVGFAHDDHDLEAIVRIARTDEGFDTEFANVPSRELVVLKSFPRGGRATLSCPHCDRRFEMQSWKVLTLVLAALASPATRRGRKFVRLT